MTYNKALKFQDDFVESLFGDPVKLFAHADHSADTFNRRLTVYRNNVFGSLQDVLTSTFPHVLKNLGGKVFQKLSHAFIRQAPPQQSLLNTYGEGFSDFLKNQRQEDIPLWIADLAHLEWLLQEAYYAEDTCPLTQEALSAIPPEKIPALVFQAAAPLRLFQSEKPELIEYFRTSDTLGNSCFYQIEGTSSGYALITRLGFQTVLSWVGLPLFSFVQSLYQKVPLEEALEDLLTKSLDFDVTVLLGTSFRLGCFSGYTPLPT